MIDPRVVRVGVTINDELKIYEGFAITAKGSKYASATQNETEITIANLPKADRDFLASEGSPFNRINQRKRQKVFVEAGRESTGTSRIFVGDITLVTVGQPPDIVTSIRAITGQYKKGEIIQTSEPALSNLSQIAEKVAQRMDLSLQFEADEKQIANYGYTGSAAKEVDNLADLAGVDVFVDDDTLVVNKTNEPLPNRTRIVSKDTGMVGKPELTDFGVNVRFFLDLDTRVNDEIEIISEVNPSANGKYIIYKLDFDIANRDLPFYYIAEARRKGGVFNG